MTLRRTTTAFLALVLFALAPAAARASGPYAPEWRLAGALAHLAFPAEAPDAADGSVRVAIEVSADGAVTSAKAQDGPSALKKPAEQAVKLWHYTKIVAGDKPTDVSSEVYVVYSAADHLFFAQGPGGVFSGPAGAAFDVGPDGKAVGAPAGVTKLDEATAPPDDLPVDRAVAVSGGVLTGKAIAKPQPPYPGAARVHNVQGEVRVEVYVERTGHVVSAKPLDGPPLLQLASVQAARGWRFSPTTLQGKPVNIVGSITFAFRRVDF